MSAHIESDWRGLLDRAAQPGNAANWPAAQASSLLTGAGKFSNCRTHTYDEALELLRYGWTEGRAMLSDSMGAIGPAFARSVSRRLDVAGAYPIAALAAAGDPACMVGVGESITPRQVLRLVVGVNFNAAVEARPVINRGAAICRVIDALEQSGTRIELVAAWRAHSMSCDSDRFTASFIVKEPDQPLELDRIAFVFAHPSMNRRIGFRLREQTLVRSRGWSDYGRPQPLRQDDYPDAVIITQITSDTQDDYSTPAKALTAVARLMAAAGIEIETHA